MNRGNPRLKARGLTPAERREIQARERRYRRKLERRGYTTRALVDETGCFGVVLVEDLQSGKKGLLLPSGKVCWMDQPMGPGALADAAVSGISIEGIDRAPSVRDKGVD